MHIRSILCAVAVAASFACSSEVRPSPSASPSEFALEELSIAQLQDGMTSGRYTSRGDRKSTRLNSSH